MIGGTRHWAALLAVAAAGSLPLEPEDNPVEVKPDVWRWRIRRRGHVAEIRGTSREDVTAKVIAAGEEDARAEEEAQRAAAEDAEKRLAEKREADRRWVEDRPQRERRIREYQEAERARMRREDPRRWARERADEYNAERARKGWAGGLGGKASGAQSAVPPLTWELDTGWWISEWWSVDGGLNQNRFILRVAANAERGLYTIDDETTTYRLEDAKKECNRRRRAALKGTP